VLPEARGMVSLGIDEATLTEMVPEVSRRLSEASELLTAI
jgi:hypothetical protein